MWSSSILRVTVAAKVSIDAVVAIRPERIVYVSCNPTTQARDIRLLSAYGYTLRLLQPIDMFPQTAHIEVVAALTSDEAGGLPALKLG